MAVTRPVTNTEFGWKWIHVCQSSRKIPAAQPYHQGRHPCNFEKKTEALRARKCASGHPAMSEARVPAGQHQKRRTLRSAQRGTECDFGKSRSLSHAPDRHPNGPRLQAWFAQRIERVARGAAPKKAYPILLAGISGPSHTRFSKSACFGSSSTNIPSTLRTLISSLVYSGNQ